MTDLSIYKGDTKTYRMTFANSSAVPINLTSSTVFFTVKENETDSDDDAVIAKDIVSHADPTSGITNIMLAHTDTDIEPKKYHYDIQLVNSTEVTTISKGLLEILQDITERI